MGVPEEPDPVGRGVEPWPRRVVSRPDTEVHDVATGRDEMLRIRMVDLAGLLVELGDVAAAVVVDRLRIVEPDDPAQSVA